MLSRPGEIVRRHDPDRFLATLFAPAEHRETLWTLYALNHELARAREAVREPMMALIRLQWWREVIEGARRQHEVATPLRAALDAGTLQAEDLLILVGGREAETERIETTEQFLTYVRAVAGGLTVAAGHVLHPASDALDAKLRDLGTAYGIAGMIRSAPAAARQGRSVLPEDVLMEAGLTAHSMTVVEPATLARALDPLRRLALVMLRAASGALPRPVLPAALPAAMVRRDLARPARAGRRGVLDQLAVLRAAVTGHIG